MSVISPGLFLAVGPAFVVGPPTRSERTIRTPPPRDPHLMGGVGGAHSSHGHRSYNRRKPYLPVPPIRPSPRPPRHAGNARRQSRIYQEGFDGHLPELVYVGSMEIGTGVGRDITFSLGLRLVVSHGRPAALNRPSCILDSGGLKIMHRVRRRDPIPII